jgi:hypothetical protein
MILLAIFLFLVLLFLMYYAYRTIEGKQVIPDWVYFWRKKKSPDSDSDSDKNPPPPPDDNALGYCTFEGEDLYEKRVYTYDGKRVSKEVSPIKCSTCNQYVYEDESGGCVKYIFDYQENSNIDDSKNVDLLCDPAHPERDKTCIQPHGVCTPSMAPSTKCPF